MPPPISGRGPNRRRSFVDAAVAATMVENVIGRNASPVFDRGEAQRLL